MVHLTQWASILFPTVVTEDDNLGKAMFPLPAVCESELMWTIRVTLANLVKILCNSWILLYKAKDMQHKKRSKYQCNI